jgi:hypothetical protein
LDKINPHDLRTDKHGLGVGPPNDKPLLRKKSDRVNALPDFPGFRFVGLREGFDGAVCEMDAD